MNCGVNQTILHNRGQQTMAHGPNIAHCPSFMAHKLSMVFTFSNGWENIKKRKEEYFVLHENYKKVST